MKLSTRICVIGIVTVLVVLLAVGLYKGNEYRSALLGEANINGYYETAVGTGSEITYLSINQKENKYYHCTADNKVLQIGKISSTDAKGIYELVGDDGEMIYAIIVSSYEKVDFVDKNMNTQIYYRKSNDIRVPS